MEPRIERLNPPQLHRPPGYHHVTVVGSGSTAYLAGQCPIDAQGDLIGRGDLEAQVDQVVQNATCALAAIGASPGDVVRSVIYVVSDTTDDLGRVWARLLGSALAPALTSAATLLGVAQLGFAGQLVEVDLTAALTVAPDRPANLDDPSPLPPNPDDDHLLSRVKPQEVDHERGDGRRDTRALTMRTAVPEDIPGILAFWQTAAEDAHRPPDSDAAVQRLLDRDPHALILAEEDGHLVGTVIAGWDGWRCHLYRLAVAPERRRQGIGSALVKQAEERFRALGGTRADAMVLQENELAHRAWRASGYREQPEWARWVKPLAQDPRSPTDPFPQR